MKIQILKSIHDFDETDWHPLVPPEFPFASYAFLAALEDSHCLGSRTGWSPLYLTAWRDQELLGVLPLFQKNNSYGEYIFDFNWAQAFESLGIAYYPKLLSAIPFTPATGPKILLNSELDETKKNEVGQRLIEASRELSQELKVSSLHALFLTESEIAKFLSAGFLIRHSFQYHWRNRNYQSFSDFLQDLRSKRRKEVLRERAQVTDSGIRIQRLTGNELSSRHADIMYNFYSDTIQKMGGFSYLTREFFQAIFLQMKSQILFVLATNSEGLPVAGALNLMGRSTLFGRYWGCLEDYKALHFELCYYQGIEFCIENKFQLFEAGAQGEHKFQRGFLPSLTYSAHCIFHPRLSEAIEASLAEEKINLQALFQDYKSHSPFSRAIETNL